MVLHRRGSGWSGGDGGVSDAPPTARWLAWAAACLLVAGLIAAGVIGFGDGSSGDSYVSAAGQSQSTVGVTSTVTVPPPSTVPPAAVAPTSSLRTTTTLPRAASALLKAIGTTAPPTTAAPPAPTTTRAPVTSTTATTATTLPPTTTTSTSTTLPRQVVAVTVVNNHPQALIVTVNDRAYDLDPTESEGPSDVTLPATGDDVIQVRVKGDDSCNGESRADHFQAGRSYRVTVAAGTPCTNYVIGVTQLP